MSRLGGTGLWILDEKMNPMFLFIQHQVSSIHDRFAAGLAV
jgi:hypothetical protein